MRSFPTPHLAIALLWATSFAQAQSVSGELKQWHKVTITFDGPATSETATPNPFADYRLDVTFAHEDGVTRYLVPGYYAADGNAADTSADAGNKWRVHFSPDRTGEWTYTADFRSGTDVAVAEDPYTFATDASIHGATGTFTVAPTDKTGRDFRGKGWLQYVEEHYPRFKGTGEYFLKQGPDSPENLLNYNDFDGTPNVGNRRKTWSPHAGDYNASQASAHTWGSGKGTELLGAIAYLASEGLNSFSFLTLSLDGDDDNVFPHRMAVTDSAFNGFANDQRWAGNAVHRDRFDCSKLDQWSRIFDYATTQGMFLHFKTQETENDQMMDGGALGRERKLYYRELIARFAHNPALNWNLGEENTNTTDQRKAFARFFHDHDPYGHPIVLHTYPNSKNVYNALLGAASELSGPSLQGDQATFSDVHGDVVTWVNDSRNAGKPWVVAYDEPGDAQNALRPDSNKGASHTNGRKNALWGTFLGGGWGNEWYFGYQYDESDLTLQNFRSRDQWWDYCRYALEFFEDNAIPVHEMVNDNGVSSAGADYCYYKQGEVYVVYLKNGGTTNLNLNGVSGTFAVRWFDPRNGGALQVGPVSEVTGGGTVALGSAPNEQTQDWTILLRKESGPPVNAAPGVDAGPDRTVPAPGNGVALDGAAFDDGLPSGILTYQWTQTGGPMVANFANANALDTTVSFGQPGTYTLQLEVSDGSLSSTNSVRIVVENWQIPVADPGPDQFLVDSDTNGSEPAQLDGSASYDPDGAIVSYAWYEGPQGPRSGCGDVWYESFGAVVIEAEDTASPLGDWVLYDDPADMAAWDSRVGDDGFHGTGCLRFDGKTEVGSGEPGTVLSYEFEITEPGNYSLRMRLMKAPKETGEFDKANDVFVRVIGQPGWLGQLTKFVTTSAAWQWQWNGRGEYAHHSFATPVYSLEPGRYTLEVAGRSKNTWLDRIIISKAGGPNNDALRDIWPPSSTCGPVAATPFSSAASPSVNMPIGVRSYVLRVTDTQGLTSPPAPVFVQVAGDGIEGPEIEILGNGTTIPDGDNAPSVADGTDFRYAAVGSAPVDRVFRVSNFGTQPLSVANPRIEGDTGSFSLLDPPVSPIPAFGSTDFTVRFAPDAGGLRTATVSIPNNDPDENLYTFSVQGGGTIPGGGGPNLVVNPEFDEAIQTTEDYWASTTNAAGIGWLQRIHSDAWTRAPGGDPFATRTGNAFLCLVQIIDVSGATGTLSLRFKAANEGSNDFEIYIWGVNVDASTQLLDNTPPRQNGTPNNAGDLLYSNTALGNSTLDWTTFEETLDFGPTGYRHLIIKVYTKSITGSEFAAIDSFVIYGEGGHSSWASVFPWPNPGVDDLPDANPDGDPWDNDFERLFQLDPLVPDNPAVYDHRIDNGQYLFEVEFQPLGNAPVTFETSTDLIQWDPATPASHEVTSDGDWEHHQLRFNRESGDSRLFLRMRSSTP